MVDLVCPAPVRFPYTALRSVTMRHNVILIIGTVCYDIFCLISVELYLLGYIILERRGFVHVQIEYAEKKDIF